MAALINKYPLGLFDYALSVQVKQHLLSSPTIYCPCPVLPLSKPQTYKSLCANIEEEYTKSHLSLLQDIVSAETRWVCKEPHQSSSKAILTVWPLCRRMTYCFLVPTPCGPLAWSWACHPAVTKWPRRPDGRTERKQHKVDICLWKKEGAVTGSLFVPFAGNIWPPKIKMLHCMYWLKGDVSQDWDTPRAQTERHETSNYCLFLTVSLHLLTYWVLLLAGCLCTVLSAPRQKPVHRFGVPTRASLCSLPGPADLHPLHSSTRSQRGGRGARWG